MNIAHLERPFARIGARVKLSDRASRRRWNAPDFSLNIREDRRGEYFELVMPESTALELGVVDTRPEQRHLLLHVMRDGQKDKFLCGHDERHWFTCVVPGDGISSVRGAMQALRPPAVLEALTQAGLRPREANRRHNAAFVRQGEWFFLPVPDSEVDSSVIHTNEPLSRGWGSKPHWVEKIVRVGGQAVYHDFMTGKVISVERYIHLRQTQPGFNTGNWSQRFQDATVYATGWVRHSDHATLQLRGWHRVLMNTEGQARAARHVVFLD